MGVTAFKNDKMNANRLSNWFKFKMVCLPAEATFCPHATS